MAVGVSELVKLSILKFGTTAAELSFAEVTFVIGLADKSVWFAELDTFKAVVLGKGELEAVPEADPAEIVPLGVSISTAGLPFAEGAPPGRCDHHLHLAPLVSICELECS